MFKTALRFIRYDKPKSLGALLGIVISVFLIGQQVGIFSFLTGLMAAFVTGNQGVGLWVVDRKVEDVNSLGQIDVRLLRQIESIEGVERAYPLVVGGATAKFENGKTCPVTLIGTQFPAFKGGPWNLVQGNPADLLEEGAVTCDMFDEKSLGGAGLGTRFELGGKKAHIAGVTRNARGFGGVLMFTTIDRVRALGKVSQNKLSAILVDIAPSADTAIVRDRINAVLPDVRAWKPSDLAASTISKILSESGIAASTGTLVIFAVISGFVIIGLTLYSAAIDRIRDYATLKAIGSTNGFVSRLILTQAFLLAVVGYVISTMLLEGFKAGVQASGLIFDYSPALRLGFFVLTLLISTTGAIFAVRKITKLEPATVFRG
jgi:putative ABC transport system permease protein